MTPLLLALTLSVSPVERSQPVVPTLEPTVVSLSLVVPADQVHPTVRRDLGWTTPARTVRLGPKL